MRLKKIAIHGFKSFADKAHVEFGPGITAIVGPNGCGKSNIIDAFRWVMGEQSAKAIRGERMVDLIFAGTSARKPLNFAEVSLTFSNEEGRLPLDVSEVAVSRRIHRDGESLFYINKAAARLKDIETLFWDTGLGKDAFSIFEQGKLDQIITSAPYERRFILEEAAGIMRFKQRKKETLKKLQLTEENLIRLKDIWQLIVQKKEHLVLQGEKARTYLEIEQKALTLEKHLALYEMQKLEEKLARLVKQLEKSQDILDSYRKEIGELELQKKERAAQKEIKSLENQEFVKTVYEKTAALELKKQRQEWLLQEKEALLARGAKIAKEAEEISFKIEENRAEKEALTDVIHKTREEAKVLIEEIEALNRSIKKIAAEEALIWKEKTLYSERKMARLREENRLKNVIEENTFKLQSGEEKRAKIASEIARLEKEQAALQSEIFDMKPFQTAVEEAKALLIAATEKEKELLQSEKILQMQEMEKARKAAALHGKISALEELKKSLQGYSSGAKKILAKGLAKPLSDVLSWHEEFEKLLAPYEHLLIVETKEKFAEILLEETLNDVALFCLEWLEGRSLEEHFLRAVRLEARPLSLQVESYGDQFWVDQKGVLFLASKGPSTVFSRKRELDGLLQEAVRLEEELLLLQGQKKSLLEDKEKAGIHAQKSARDLKEQEMRKGAAEASLVRIAREKERLDKLLTSFVKESEALTVHYAELVNKKSLAEESLKTFQSAEEPLPDFDEILRGLGEEKNILENQLREKNRLHQHLLSVLQSKEPRLGAAESKASALIERAELLRHEEEELNRGLEKCRAADLHPLDQEEQELTLLKEELAVKSEELKGFQLSLESLDTELESKKAPCEKQGIAHERYGVEKAQNTTALLMLEERYVQQFGEKEPYPEAAPQGNLASLKEEMASLGAINFSAAEELADAEKEAEELTHQITDLEKAKNDLYAVIQSLDTESSARFLQTFEQVKTAFQRNFTTLFGGGSADLQLVGSDDPLESGIDIYAMPPGKAMKSLYLMSGGERCLTALALLFALFEVRPSAFCLLDEVDAPLDEANVERFAKMVSSYIDKTQFVIITHNKNTMAIADRLLGVSAEEKGVSQVIPLELKTCR